MEKRVLFGWLLLLIGIAPALTFLLALRPQYVVWFSNHTFIILGLALLLKSPFWVFAQLCIGFVPELMWSVDFLARLFTGSHIWGFTSYMFKNGAFDWLHLYSLQHVLFVPAAIYALYLLGGPVKKAWIGSGIHFAVLWPVSMIWGTEFNLNCVFYDCGILSFLPEYQITWPALMMVHVLLVYLLFMKLKKK